MSTFSCEWIVYKQKEHHAVLFNAQCWERCYIFIYIDDFHLKWIFNKRLQILSRHIKIWRKWTTTKTKKDYRLTNFSVKFHFNYILASGFTAFLIFSSFSQYSCVFCLSGLFVACYTILCELQRIMLCTKKIFTK